MAGYGAPISPVDVPDVAHPAPVDGYSPQSLNRYGAWCVFVLAAESDEALLARVEQPLDSTVAGRVLKDAGEGRSR